MLRTELEAAGCWCPLARLARADELGMPDQARPAHNRAYAVYDHRRIDIAAANCIGSRCMFWQWHDGKTANERRRGYCGAARQIVAVSTSD